MSFLDPLGLFSSFRDNEGQTEEQHCAQIPSFKSGIPNIAEAFFGPFAWPEGSTTSGASSSSSPSPTIIATKEGESPEHYTEHGGLFPPGPSSAGYDVTILGIPDTGARSRTETQVKLIVRVRSKDSNRPPIRYLALPRHQLAAVYKGSHIGLDTENAEGPDYETMIPHDTLRVRAKVVRSDSEEFVYSCYGCILRERRRGLRKRYKSSLDEVDSEEEPPHEAQQSEKETEQDLERILIFASANEKVQLIRGDVMLPVRLTCYCRHHEEKVGFRVRLDLLDCKNTLVASAFSPPVMITDDHKRTSKGSRAIPTNPISLPPAEPTILKIIPSEGPLYGGIEITALGRNLTPESLIFFGDLYAKVITFVNSSTVIVRLPASLTAGMVPVRSFGRETPRSLQVSTATAAAAAEIVLFNYKDDLDRAMMELALQLIGMKMTGRVDDAREVAMKIINEFGPAVAAAVGNGIPPVVINPGAPNQILEQVLITCLAAAKVSGGIRLSSQDLTGVRTAAGQTLLHLAALAKFDHLFEYLCCVDNDQRLASVVDSNHLTAKDYIFLMGRENFLQNLGIDESVNEEEWNGGLDFISRYRLLQKRVADRMYKRKRDSLWDAVSNTVSQLRKRPHTIRNHMNRLRNVIWRKLSSEEAIKTYYRSHFGIPSLNATSKALAAGSHIYRKYRQYSPFAGRRARDLMLLYFWIPIVIAAVSFWLYNGYTSLMMMSPGISATNPTILVK